jgi:hypothetical protein
MHRYSNQISTTISKADLKEILNAIAFIDDKLSNLVNLSEEEIASLPRGKCSTIAFVRECLNYAGKYPDYIPSDIEVKEIRKDVELVESLLAIMEPLQKVMKKLDDSALLASSEAYIPSLIIHNTVKSYLASRTGTKKDLHPA